MGVGNDEIIAFESSREEAIATAILEARGEALMDDCPVTIRCCVDFDGCTKAGRVGGCDLCEHITVHPDGRVTRAITRN